MLKEGCLRNGRLQDFEITFAWKKLHLKQQSLNSVWRFEFKLNWHQCSLVIKMKPSCDPYTTTHKSFLDIDPYTALKHFEGSLNAKPHMAQMAEQKDLNEITVSQPFQLFKKRPSRPQKDLPVVTLPFDGSTHQQMPSSHCSSSQLPLDLQCNVTSVRSLRREAQYKFGAYNHYCLGDAT